MLNQIRYFFALLFISLLVISCSDEPGTGEGAGPTVTLETTTPILVDVGMNFTVTVDANDGDVPLNALTVLQNGVNLDPGRIVSINGNSLANNPFLITGGDKDGGTFDIVITTHAALESRTYTVVITDENQSFASVNFDVETIGLGPSITQMSSGNIPAPPNTKVNVEITGSKGTGSLSTITVTEDGVLMDPSRVFYNGISMSVDDNPYTLPAADQNGFTSDLTIQSSVDVGMHTYVVTLTDEFGLTASTQFVISTGTDIDDSLTGILLNSAGPAGQGGLDLDTGASTNSDAPAAEINDEGIDSDLPPADNWLQAISGANGSTVKYLIPGQNGLSESFTFESVQFKEDLPSLINNGVDFTQTNEDGEPISDTVEAGDVFIVQNGSKFYLLKVTEVNVRPTNNTDNYVIDIKK